MAGTFSWIERGRVYSGIVREEINGEIYEWLSILVTRDEDDEISVRQCHGEYCYYDDNGVGLRNISRLLSFTEMSLDEAYAKGWKPNFDSGCKKT